MTETKSPTKKAAPRKRRKRTSLTAKLRERNSELRIAQMTAASAQALVGSKTAELDQVRYELQERLESSQYEARDNRAKYERYMQYYREEQEIRRNTREALDLVFAALAPGLPMNTLLEVLESVGKEMYNSRMDIVRPFIIEGLAEGTRQGIPLYAKRKAQKEKDKKKAEESWSKVNRLAALLGMDDPTQGEEFGKGCDCPECSAG